MPIDITDAIRDATLYEQQNLSISFSGEAGESFAARIDGLATYAVRITPQEGEPFDAVIVGSGQDVVEDGNGWYDAVRFWRADEDGLPLTNAIPEVLRVRDVHVY